MFQYTVLSFRQFQFYTLAKMVPKEIMSCFVIYSVQLRVYSRYSQKSFVEEIYQKAAVESISENSFLNQNSVI